MDNNKKMNNPNDPWWPLSMEVTQNHLGYFVAKITLGGVDYELESRSMTLLMLKLTKLVSLEENSASVRYGMSQLVPSERE